MLNSRIRLETELFDQSERAGFVPRIRVKDCSESQTGREGLEITCIAKDGHEIFFEVKSSAQISSAEQDVSLEEGRAR